MARILMVDDDEVIHELFGEAFEIAGHSVAHLDDGLLAMSTLTARQFDLLILDCNMPEMCGLEVLRQVRAHQDLCLLPVLVLTGHASPQDRVIAEYARADLFCSKASDPDWLVYQAEILIAEKVRIAPVKKQRSPLGKPFHSC